MTDSWSHNKSPAAQIFGTLLDASPDALLAIAADGSITAANAAAGNLFGYSTGDLAGRDHRTLLAEGF
ncbi:MAG: PAS domain S-box protein, partial [Actinomycetes bacterium]